MHGITGNACITQHCGHEKAKRNFLSISVDTWVAVNNTRALSFGREMQKWDPFELLSSYKMYYC
jgi:hypothetical protein